jgi:hypothetical protein
VKSLIFRPAAAADVEEAYDWYESQRTGLGEEFLESAPERSQRGNPTEAVPSHPAHDTSSPPPTLSLRPLLSCLRALHCYCRLNARASKPAPVAITAMILVCGRAGRGGAPIICDRQH